jgi:biotin-(acetyl-CoA carboxylase) ligase
MPRYSEPVGEARELFMLKDEEELTLPPAYSLVEVSPYTDATSHALRLAGGGEAEDGTIVCSKRENVFDCAVVLSAEQPLEQSALVVLVAVMALADALSATSEPGTKVGYEWPNVVTANDREIGKVDIHLPEGTTRADTPGWIVINPRIGIMGPPDGDARLKEAGTTLHFEGSYDTTPGQLLQSFGRYFLTWVNRWLDEGFKPIADSWSLRATEARKDLQVTVEFGGEKVTGVLVGLDEFGGLILKPGRKRKTLGLLDALGL